MKRVALISDIHGNAAALEAVLADVRRRPVDEIVCLGDVAAGGPQPREALERLRRLGCAVVRGNADDWLLGEMAAEEDEDGRRLRVIVEWARRELGDADVAYVESFPPTIELDLAESRRLLCFHGSMRANSDRLLATTPEEELVHLLAGAAADVLAGGHTHLQLARRLERGLLVNPGSIGLPLRTSAAASLLSPGRPCYRASPSTRWSWRTPRSPSSCAECRSMSRRSSARSAPPACPIRTGGWPDSRGGSRGATPSPSTRCWRSDADLLASS